MNDELTLEEKNILLRLAREAILAAVCEEPLPILDLEALPERLRLPGATFVTITRRGALRGCIGTLDPNLPLAEDVRLHAVAAALQDYRFPPVCPEEIQELEIEISRLTAPRPVEYGEPKDLLTSLRPRVDGVLVQDGFHRATFLPQVWEKIPEPAEFLAHLCMKMGCSPNHWMRKKLQVAVYQVEEFHEEHLRSG